MLRYELKYIITEERINEVREKLCPFLEYDNFASKNGGQYTVRSIYFDTPAFECYTTKIMGVKHRNKLRIRGYNSESPDAAIFFEIKKKFEHPIFKHRVLTNFKTVPKVFDSTSGLEDNEDIQRFLYHIYSRQMNPVVNVIYEREAYEAPTADLDNRLRITFDKNLRAMPYPKLAELYQEEGAVRALPGHFILEVKFNHFMPAWLSESLHALNIKRESASKYCMSIDASEEINPDSRYDAMIHSRFSHKESN